MPDNQELKLSVVIPAYNEEEVLPEFHKRLTSVLEEIEGTCEILYVNDGSSDRTLEVLNDFKDPRVAIIDLSRNFGKEIALTAGLDHARGEAVVVIDADLQDPPELIPKFIEKWQEGYDVVYARRTARDGETFIKRQQRNSFTDLSKASVESRFLRTQATIAC